MNHLNNELLHVPTIPFDFKNPPVDPTELVEQLTNQMIALRGVGLSANQVGVWRRKLFIFSRTISINQKV